MEEAEGGENSVVVIDGRKLVRRTVTLGINDGANVVVTSGLKEGDRIVRSVEFVKAGKKDDSKFRMGPPERKKRE